MTTPALIEATILFVVIAVVVYGVWLMWGIYWRWDREISAYISELRAYNDRRAGVTHNDQAPGGQR